MTGLGRTGDGDGGARLWPSDQQSESCRTQCWPFATPYRASSGTHPGGAQPPRHCHHVSAHLPTERGPMDANHSRDEDAQTALLLAHSSPSEQESLRHEPSRPRKAATSQDARPTPPHSRHAREDDKAKSRSLHSKAILAQVEAGSPRAIMPEEAERSPGKAMAMSM